MINLLLLASLVFILKLIECSITTLSIIFISQKNKKLTLITSTIEITIYLFVINRLLQDSQNLFIYFSWGLAFVLGNIGGIYLEEIIQNRLNINYNAIKIISKRNADALIKRLKIEKYNTTIYNAKNKRATPVTVINIIVKQRQTNEILKLVEDYDKTAICTIENLQFASV